MSEYLKDNLLDKVTKMDFVPSKIIARKFQKQELSEYCFENLKSAENILITGDISGSGKTVLVKHYLNKLKNGTEGIYINTADMSNFSLSKTIATSIGNLVNKQLKGRELATFSEFCREIIKKYKGNIVIVLDEIDGYLKKNEDISTLYSLSELARINNCITLIFISNDIDFGRKLLDRYLGKRIYSRLCYTEIFFDKYAVSEAAEILLYYSKLIIKPNHFKGDNLIPKLLKFVRDINEFDIRLLLKNYISIIKNNVKNEEPLLTYNKEFLIDSKLQNNWLAKFDRLNESEKLILLSLIALDEKLESEKQNQNNLKYYNNIEPTTKIWFKSYNTISTIIPSYIPIKERLFKKYIYSLEKYNFVKYFIKAYGKGRGRKALWFPHMYLKEMASTLFGHYFGEETLFLDVVRKINVRRKYIS